MDIPEMVELLNKCTCTCIYKHFCLNLVKAEKLKLRESATIFDKSLNS